MLFINSILSLITFHLSLNHDLASILHVDALACRLALDAAALEVEDALIIYSFFIFI